jgi:hypothetical protein
VRVRYGMWVQPMPVRMTYHLMYSTGPYGEG